MNWFKEQFGHHEQLQAAAQGLVPEELFDELVNAVRRVRAMGLMLQPYWTPGIKVPGPEAKVRSPTAHREAETAKAHRG